MARPGGFDLPTPSLEGSSAGITAASAAIAIEKVALAFDAGGPAEADGVGRSIDRGVAIVVPNRDGGRKPTRYQTQELRYVPAMDSAGTINKVSWETEGTLAYAERQALIAALHASSFRISDAARILQIGRSTIYRLIRKYRVSMPGLSVGADTSTRVPKPIPTPATASNDRPEPLRTTDGRQVVLREGAYYLTKD